MPISVDWGNIDKTMLICRFDRYWRANDFFKSINQCYILTQRQIHPVDLVLDFQGSLLPPFTLLSIAQVSFRRAPHNTGSIIMICHKVFWSRLDNIFVPMYRSEAHHIQFARDANAMYELLAMLPAAV